MLSVDSYIHAKKGRTPYTCTVWLDEATWGDGSMRLPGGMGMRLPGRMGMRLPGGMAR